RCAQRPPRQVPDPVRYSDQVASSPAEAATSFGSARDPWPIGYSTHGRLRGGFIRIRQRSPPILCGYPLRSGKLPSLQTVCRISLGCQICAENAKVICAIGQILCPAWLSKGPCSCVRNLLQTPGPPIPALLGWTEA